ncbi:type I restriction-modification system [Klebsiella michiganensis]|uniref:Type I restriction-modification system n=1 Tax=Klebsiella michiganensis TaxID=1134687 RepID=A0A7H4PHA6_9ENTR|nr:type I restriction-modification system [Klebsiella michiganensis]
MCDSQSDSTPFIEFMLENMVIALKDGMGQTASLSEGNVGRNVGRKSGNAGGR